MRNNGTAAKRKGWSKPVKTELEYMLAQDLIRLLAAGQTFVCIALTVGLVLLSLR